MSQVDKLFFPPACLNCSSRVTSPEQVLCADCLAQAVPITENYCAKCGAPLKDYSCEACSLTEFFFDLARSGFLYSDTVKQLVHQLKYNALLSPAAFFAGALLKIPAAKRFSQGYDLVSSVPLHRVRKRDRGFNQSELIGRKLAQALNLPYSEPVFRQKNTASQTNLSGEQRKLNLLGAFALRKNADIADKRIILVDDVFTTGSTANEISRVLKDKGAAKVLVLTAARAV